jgi:hypothetical protein
MKHFRRIIYPACPRSDSVRGGMFTTLLGLPILLLILCFLVNCTGEQWVDNGVNYLCPECKDSPFFQLGDICERCGAGTDVNPLKYCYDCATELNCCQRCGIER